MPPPSRKKRILLIHCGLDKRFMDIREQGFDPERGMFESMPMTPLACATLAALTPEEYEVDIWDEDLRGQIRVDTPLEGYDIVGVSVIFSAVGYQARFLGMHFRSQGAVVVAGGPGVSSSPEEFRGFFDALFVNEAERTWPRFLRDYESGTIQPEYRQIDKPELSESPRPKWTAVAGDIPRYNWGTVQTTRGCPFDCEFCDVIYLFGRRQRHKPVEQVVEEVRALEALGAPGIFFADDEFVGDPPYTKKLLSALIPVNNAFRRPLRYFTQATLNMSRDEELLALMADVNFYSVVLGVESFDKDSLRETHKYQNIRQDLIGDIQKIQGYGIGPRASFIVGFDHDGPGVFETLREGIQRACIPWPVVSVLQAPHHTRLWTRLRSEGRIAHLRNPPSRNLSRLLLNIIPKGMSRVELLEGYHDLLQSLYDWEAACARIRGWAAMVHRPPRVEEVKLTPEVYARLLSDMEASWQLSARDRALIGDLLDEARRAFPHLLNRIVFFLLIIHSERVRYARLFMGYEQLLEAERTGDLVIDQKPVLIPKDFGTALSGVFPELYARLHGSLPDKSLIPEAARDVLVDFLVRWGGTFQKLEPQHRAILLELCDRTSTKLGGQPAMPPAEEAGPLMTAARKSRLLEAVLKDVRDELSRGVAV